MRPEQLALGPVLSRAPVGRPTGRRAGSRPARSAAAWPRRRAPGPRPGPRRRTASSPPNRACESTRPLLDQHQERGLERIVGIVRIAQDVAADPQHHRPVPGDQGLERRLGRALTRAGEPLDQVPIRRARSWTRHRTDAHVTLQRCGRSTGHAPVPPKSGSVPSCLPVVPGASEDYP